jgi:hypothetical protein
VIQQHVLFFDTDGDGIIWPLDTYRGFRELGFNIPFSLMTIIINLAFSFPTRIAHTWLPDPFFRIYVDSMYKAKVWLPSCPIPPCEESDSSVARLRLRCLRQRRPVCAASI